MKTEKKYQILMINAGTLENMGTYYGYSREDALNNMANSGNLLSSEYSAKYYVVPISYMGKRMKIKE